MRPHDQSEEKLSDSIGHLVRAISILAQELSQSRSLATLATKDDLKQLEQKLMSAITDFAATVQTSFDAVSKDLDNITAGIAALDVLIVNFQNSPGTLSPADQAALDGIVAASAALKTKADAVDTTAPVPTPAQLKA